MFSAATPSKTAQKTPGKKLRGSTTREAFAPATLPARIPMNTPSLRGDPRVLTQKGMQFLTPKRTNAAPEKNMMTPGAALAFEINKNLYETSNTQLQQLIFAQTDAYNVKFDGDLPLNVTEYLSTRGLWFTGGIGLYLDTIVHDLNCIMSKPSGYIALTTSERCFVWHSKKLLGNSKEFKVPNPPHRKAPHILITPSLTDDPLHSGLLLCTELGVVRYWIDMTKDQYLETTIPIHQDDRIISFVCADPVGYILGTSKNSLHKLVLDGHDGQVQITSSQIKESSRIFQSFYISNSSLGKLVSIIPSPHSKSKLTRDIYALSSEGVELWTISKTSYPIRNPIKNLNIKVTEYIHAALQNTENALPKIHLLDMQFSKNGVCYILTCFSHDGVKMNFVLVSFDFSQELVIEARQLDYTIVLFWQCDFNPKAKCSQKINISIPNGGFIAFVTFPDAVLIVSLETREHHLHIINDPLEYQQIVKIAEANMDQIIGIGYDMSRIHIPEPDSISELTFMCKSSGMLKLSVNLIAVRGARDNNDHFDQMYTRLQQTLLYCGPHSVYNPLTFNYTNKHNDQTNAACLKLSNDILTGECEDVVDLKFQLSEKFRRLDDIIYILNLWDIVKYVSDDTRTALCFNTATALSTLHLWVFQNSFSETERPSKFDIVAKSIQKIQKSKKISTSEVRTFFRKHAAEIHLLVDSIGICMDEACSENDKALHIYYIGKCLSILLSNANEYVTKNDIYGLDRQSMTRTVWACRVFPSISAYEIASLQTIRILEKTIQMTMDILSVSNQKGQLSEEHKNIDASLTNQLASLVEYYLGACITLMAAFKSKRNQDSFLKLEAEYRNRQPILVTFLYEHGLVSQSLTLCEKYRDFESLVFLVLKSQESQKTRIHQCTKKFASKFAYPLYENLIKNDKKEQLFALPDEHDALLVQFLANHSELSWIHDLKLKQYSNAADTLYKVSEREVSIKKKSVLLSLAKISYACGLEEEDMITDDSQFCLITAYQKWVTELMQTLANKFETGPIPSVAPAYQPIINLAITKLRAGEKVGDVMLLDVLTLCTQDYASAYKIALQIEKIDTVLRRAWLSNDWEFGKLTDAQLHNYLKTTPLYILIKQRIDITSFEYRFVGGIEMLRSLYPFLDRSQFTKLYEEYQKENVSMSNIKGRIDYVLNECYRMIEMERDLEL